MADINYSINAQLQKGALSQAFLASGVTADMNANGMMSVTLLANTYAQTVSTASLSAVGMCFARSLASESTHTVSLGRVDGTNLWATISLRGGEAAVFRLAPGDYGVVAAEDGTKLQLTILED